MSKTIDVMPGDTWTLGFCLWQYRNRMRRAAQIIAISDWERSDRLSHELDCTPAQAMNILAAYGYTINHAQPEAKPVRVTHGVYSQDDDIVICVGTHGQCKKWQDVRGHGYFVVPLAFGPEPT